ncbi:MAG: DUF4199 domain-containing protein [Flavobacterium sp.]|nr:DUF4199 domain-containing protein [Flavobacterium sp.]
MQKFSIELKWALIFTVVSLIWNIGEKSVGLHGALISQHLLYSSFFAVVAIAVYVLAIRDKKNNYFNSNMTWSQGFVSGGVLSVMIAMFSPIVIFITYEMLSPNYFQSAVQSAVAKGATIEKSRNYFNLQSYVLQAAFSALSMGAATSAVIALFLQTKNTQSNA